MNLLKNYLNEKKETVAAFARRSGLNQPTVWRIVNGRVKACKPATALKIERATNGAITAMQLIFELNITKR